MAFIGDWDAKKYLELLRKNPELRREEYEFIREKATLVKEIAIQVSRNGPVVFEGDRVDQVDIQGGNAESGGGGEYADREWALYRYDRQPAALDGGVFGWVGRFR